MMNKLYEVGVEQNITLLLVWIMTIILDTAADAARYKYDIYSSNNRRYGIMYHMFEAAMIAVFILGILGSFMIQPDGIVSFGLEELVKYTAGYILLRFAMFDYLYNWFTDRNVMYIGKTSLYDILLQKVNIKHSTKTFVMWGLKCVSLLTGVVCMTI